MKVTLQKWGNSKGIRIPKSILEQLGIKDGDKLDLCLSDNQMIIRKKINDEMNIREVAQAYYGESFKQLKNIYNEPELDFGEPIGEEVL